MEKIQFRQLYPLFSFCLLIFLWWIVSRFSGWSEQVFPGPVKTALGMWELIENGALFRHCVASLFRVTAGFYLAIITGIPLGIILGRKKMFMEVFNPIIQFLRPISPLAWIPLAMLWFGIGDKPAVFLIFLASFFPLAVSTIAAVVSINPVYFHVAANFNFSPLETVFKIIVPAILPSVVTALRITVTIAWLVVVAAEMIAVTSGLGYLIIDSRNALRMDYVLGAMIVIGLIGLVLDFFMMRLSLLDSLVWGNLTR